MSELAKVIYLAWGLKSCSCITLRSGVIKAVEKSTCARGSAGVGGRYVLEPSANAAFFALGAPPWQSCAKELLSRDWEEGGRQCYVKASVVSSRACPVTMTTFIITDIES